MTKAESGKVRSSDQVMWGLVGHLEDLAFIHRWKSLKVFEQRVAPSDLFFRESLYDFLR